MKSLVLCGGGIKSAFLAIEAAKESEISLLFLDHGQSSTTAEIKALTYIAERCKVTLIQTKLQGFPPLNQPLLRLLCYFSQAVPIARHFGYHKIYYGINRDDLPYNTDPKLTEEFIKNLQHLLSISLPMHTLEGFWLGELEIDTPLRKLRLEHVLRLGNEWKIDWRKTWSCIKGGIKHCGVCPKCVRRQKAFIKEGSREDPTDYVTS